MLSRSCQNSAITTQVKLYTFNFRNTRKSHGRNTIIYTSYVHFTLVCHTLFVDNCFIQFHFEPNLTQYASTFFMYSEVKLELDPTKDISFPRILPLENRPLLAMPCLYISFPKLSDFLQLVSMGKFCIFCRIQLKFRF